MDQEDLVVLEVCRALLCIKHGVKKEKAKIVRYYKEEEDKVEDIIH